jgi:hypothetical protein
MQPLRRIKGEVILGSVAIQGFAEKPFDRNVFNGWAFKVGVRTSYLRDIRKIDVNGLS